MASIELTKLSLSSLKNGLIKIFPEIKSSHQYEALAKALGHNTYASLLAETQRTAYDPPIQRLNEVLFIKRLNDFGYHVGLGFNFDQLGKPYIIPTRHKSSDTIDYDSERRKAWRNLMVYVINVGLQSKLFSLRPDDNRWSENGKGHHFFNCELPNGLPVRVYFASCIWGELRICADVNPKKYFSLEYQPGFRVGDAHAAAWLEREKGAWLQFTNDFNCRKFLLPYLAGLKIEPNGFGDRAKLYI